MKTNMPTGVKFVCILIGLLIGVGALFIGVIDLKAGRSYHSKATLVGTYIVSGPSGRGHMQVYYADILFENKIVSIPVVRRKNYEKLSQMSSACGSLDFTAQYKIGYFSKKQTGVRIVLNSNEQYRSPTCLNER